MVASLKMAKIMIEQWDSDRMPENLKLQMLVWIALGIDQVMNDYEESIEPSYAWDFGPVFPVLYDALRPIGRNKVSKKWAETFGSLEIDEKRAKQWRSISSAVIKSYGSLDQEEILAIVTRAQGPWARVWWSGKNYDAIDPKSIKSYYESKVTVRS